MEGSLKAEYPEEAMLQQIITITARQRRKIEELWMCEEGSHKKAAIESSGAMKNRKNSSPIKLSHLLEISKRKSW